MKKNPNLPKLPFIEDKLFEHYIIMMDNYNYIVVEPKLNSYITLGYFRNLSSAIYCIMGLINNKNNYSSLEEYIIKWEKLYDEFKQIYNKIKLEDESFV